MRKLTKQEATTREKFYEEWEESSPIVTTQMAFYDGFRAGLDYQQHKLNAYADYMAGKITLKELEEVINQ